MTIESLSSRRPVGRPRKDGRPHLKREQVFWVSARLIAQHGYAGTSVRMIASALGTSPASLFNLFASKEQLLNELIVYASGPSLAFYAELRKLDLTPAVALYKSLYEEVKAVASAERSFPAMFYLPELHQEGFELAQKMRADMVGHYRDLLEAGSKAQLFFCDHSDLVAEQFFQLTETTIVARDKLQHLKVDAQATSTADLCLRAVLREPGSVASVREEAHKVQIGVELPVGPES